MSTCQPPRAPDDLPLRPEQRDQELHLARVGGLLSALYESDGDSIDRSRLDPSIADLLALIESRMDDHDLMNALREIDPVEAVSELALTLEAPDDVPGGVRWELATATGGWSCTA